MTFPKNRDEAELQGYQFLGAGNCKCCGVSIEWYETPNGKRIPICDPQEFKAHWVDCPKAKEFRKKQKEKP